MISGDEVIDVLRQFLQNNRFGRVEIIYIYWAKVKGQKDREEIGKSKF